MHSERCTTGSARGHAKLPVVRSARRACATQPFLPTEVAGGWLYLYLILDVYSRKIVGFEVHEDDDCDHAARLVRRTMSLAQDEAVARDSAGIGRIYPQHGKVEGGEDIHAGQAGAQMGRPGLVGSLDDAGAKQTGPILQFLDLAHDVRLCGCSRRVAF